MAEVIDNKALSRFELDEQDGVSFADYVRRHGVIVVTHVETPVPLRGRGIAARLMKGLLEIARQEGARVRPVCPYAAAYMQRHPEERDLLA
jgi:predicted GNAT family acetyltransferase